MGDRYMLSPQEMESRFSSEQGLHSIEYLEDELCLDSQEKIEKVQALLGELPPREADFLVLYYFLKVRQTDIATLFGVSQPTVCYRLQRSASRLLFLMELPKFSIAKLEEVLKSELDDPLDVQVMMGIVRSSCQSEVAKRLGESQGLVRHRFLRSLSRLRKCDRYPLYVQIFESIAQNLNILRDIQRFEGADRVTSIVL